MLPTNVKTTSDLMSIALQAEREAIRRYTKLSSNMRDGDNKSAASIFERMVIEEQEHERLLLEWMKQENIDENQNIEPVKWRDPNVSTTYNDDAQDSHYCTPYKALAFAVHNEEIAFRFYTHVAANTKNDTVREYAEILAREELGHAALLRAERRLAFHAERESNATEPRLDPSVIYSEADLLAAAIHIDRYLLEQMLDITHPEISSLATNTRQQINVNEQALKNKISPGNEVIENLEQLKSHNNYIKQRFDQPGDELKCLWSCCDRSFAFYDAIVTTTSNEAIMLTAQKLTSTALDRIGTLKHLFNETDITE